MSPPAPWLSSLLALPALARAHAALAGPGRVSLSGPGGPARALVPLLVADPPLLSIDDGELGRGNRKVDMRSGGITYGGLDSSGRPTVASRSSLKA